MIDNINISLFETPGHSAESIIKAHFITDNENKHFL